jgi:hypothetical protein
VKRVVKLALVAYTDADGLDRFGWRGEHVDVHPDHVARFDELNVVPGEPAVQEPVLAVTEPVPAEDNSVPKPQGNAALEDWQEYARSKGATDADLEGKTRNAVRDQYGS